MVFSFIFSGFLFGYCLFVFLRRFKAGRRKVFYSLSLKKKLKVWMFLKLLTRTLGKIIIM